MVLQWCLSKKATCEPIEVERWLLTEIDYNVLCYVCAVWDRGGWLFYRGRLQCFSAMFVLFGAMEVGCFREATAYIPRQASLCIHCDKLTICDFITCSGCTIRFTQLPEYLPHPLQGLCSYIRMVKCFEHAFVCAKVIQHTSTVILLWDCNCNAIQHPCAFTLLTSNFTTDSVAVLQTWHCRFSLCTW